MHRRAFTLMELIVVMGILALLMALLLPALGSARGQADKTQELNNLRQIGAAWALYSTYSNEQLMPGFIAPEVQEKWDVSYSLRYDGTAIAPNDAAPYPLRLLPYMDDHHALFIEYRNEVVNTNPVMRVSEIAHEPAFGCNALYLGGWYESVDPGTGRARARFEAARVIARSIAQIDRSEEIIVFASSAERAGGQTYDRVPETAAGAAFVFPPIVAQTSQWDGSSGAIAILADTFAPIMRYTNQAAVVHADGHTSSEGPQALSDQRRWIPRARDRDFTHPK